MNILIVEIKKLIIEDQIQIRSFKQGAISNGDLLKKSKEITKRFLNLLDKYGFPYKNLVPKDIYNAGITLSLHADLKTLENIFNTYVRVASLMEIDPEHKAIFIDKIRILSNKPQLYGTQYKIDENKEIKLLPVEDENNLENRRKELGLKSLDEYLKTIDI